MINLPWISKKSRPQNRQLCLVILHDQIVLNIMVWFDKDNAFVMYSAYQGELVEVKLRLDETNGWLPLRDIPLPEWIKPREEIKL